MLVAEVEQRAEGEGGFSGGEDQVVFGAAFEDYSIPHVTGILGELVELHLPRKWFCVFSRIKDFYALLFSIRSAIATLILERVLVSLNSFNTRVL